MADHCVSILRRAVEKAGIGRETAFIIAADHGFHRVYQEINVAPFFEKAGLLERSGCMAAPGTMAVELTDRFNRSADMAALGKAFDVLRAEQIVRRIAAPTICWPVHNFSAVRLYGTSLRASVKYIWIRSQTKADGLAVTSVAFRPDGRQLLAANKWNTTSVAPTLLKVWNLETGAERFIDIVNPISIGFSKESSTCSPRLNTIV
jgi:hypothetical protein